MRIIFTLISITILCVTATIIGTFYQTESINYEIPPNIQFSDLTKPTRKQIECLADNIYFESASEPKEGQIAVALVTLNRLASRNYADSICDVVKQKIGQTCQFSWVCSLKSHSKKLIKEPEKYENILQLATTVYFNYELIKDSTNGATYYHANYVRPKWRLRKSTQIGKHIFYVKREDKENIKKEI